MSSEQRPTTDSAVVVGRSRKGVARLLPPKVATAVGTSMAGAGIGLTGGPLTAMFGAAVAPVLQAVAERTLVRRAQQVSARWESTNIDASAVADRAASDPEAMDILRSGLEASLSTESESKRAVLADAIAVGVLTKDDIERATARRFISTLARIDTVEALLMSKLSDAGRADPSELRTAIATGDAALIDAALALMVGEGLVAKSLSQETVALTDFGIQLLQSLRDAGLES